MDDIQAAQALLETIRSENSNVENPSILSFARQSFKLISEQLYSNPTQFLLELIQNADDNHYVSSTPTLCISYQPGYLRLDCNEVGFTDKNVEAICAIGKIISGQLTRAKGLGFKSVFKVADAVWIHSRHYNFKLDTREDGELGMISPRWDAFPQPIKPGFTSFYLRICENYEEDVIKEVRHLDLSLLLFLRRLERIELKITQKDGTTWSDRLGREEQREGAEDITRLFRNGYDMRYSIREHVVSELPAEPRRPGISQSKITLGFPILDWIQRPYLKIENTYTSLFIREYGLPFMLQADFLLTDDREDIVHPSAWNLALLRAITYAFMGAIDDFLAGPLRYRWPNYVPIGILSPPFNLVMEDILEKLPDKKIFESYDRSMCPAKSLTYVPPIFRDEAKIPLALSSLTAQRYLSPKYAAQEIDVLIKLGVQSQSTTGFLQDLKLLEDEFHLRSPSWHSQLAFALWDILADPEPESYKLIETIKLIPLQNGTWTSAREGPIYFAKDFIDPSIPSSIDITMVEEAATTDGPRRRLLEQLGVRVLNTSEVCAAIIRVHASMELGPLPLTREQLVAHATYLYEASWRAEYPVLFFFVTTKGKQVPGHQVYAQTPDDKEAASREYIYHLFHNEFDFIHADYMTAIPANDKKWFQWLSASFNVSTISESVEEPSHNQTSTFKLPEEIESIFNQDDYYYNALYAASTKNYEAAVALLLQHDTNINAQSRRAAFDNALLAALTRGHTQVVKLLLEALGEERPNTFTTMANLAETYRSQGRWKEAEELLAQAVETKRMHGDENPDTLIIVAETYMSQGRWKEAEGLLMQVVEVTKRMLGDEHPITLTTMANLALTYMSQGRWKEAEELLSQVRETTKRVLGDEHLNTFTTMANLALTYISQGQWKEAEELLVQAQETTKRVLGNEHPDTLATMANLALTYMSQGRWKEAEKLLVQAGKTTKRVLGHEHPITLTTMVNLALTYMSQGQWKEAEKLLVQVEETTKRMLGDEHPITLTTMANLALTYISQGRWKEAEELLVQAIEIRKRVLGDEHPITLTTMVNLALTYISQGLWKEAEELLVQVVEIGKRVLGDEHPDMLTIMANLADTYRSQGRWKEAEELNVQIMETRKRVLKQSEYCASVVSNNEETDSKIGSRARSPGEMSASKLFGNLLGGLSELRPLHEKALIRLGQDRFVRNYCRILKLHLLSLQGQPGTRNRIENFTIKILRSRQNRTDIARRIVQELESDEELPKPLHALNYQPLEKESLGRWRKSILDVDDLETTQELEANSVIVNQGEHRSVVLEIEIDSANSTSDNSDEEEESANKGILGISDDFDTDVVSMFPDASDFLHRDIRTLELELRLLVLPTSLREVMETVPKEDILISAANDTSLVNRFKAFVEDNTTIEWEWWPLRPRISDLPRDRRRLEWQVSGRVYYQEISSEEADALQDIVDRVDDHPPKCCCYLCYTTEVVQHDVMTLLKDFFGLFTSGKVGKVQSSGPNQTWPPSTAEQRYTPPTATATGASSSTSQSIPLTEVAYRLNKHTGNVISAPSAGANNLPINAPCVPLWIIFGIQDHSKNNEIENISMSQHLKNDAAFFGELKRLERKYRWPLLRWFSPYVFTHCKFVKFEAMDIDFAFSHGEGLPEDDCLEADYIYNPRPPDAKNPLIGKHEFKRYLHTCETPCLWSYIPVFKHKCSRLRGDSHKWQKIPSKKAEFDITTWRENHIAFGIEAVYALSFPIVFTYHMLLILACLGFWIWWLENHPNDLQNASVPVVAMVAILSSFWMLPGRGNGV